MTAQEKNAYQAAVDIIAALRAGDHAALLAGGCVRDRLLGRVPKDFDVATDATPDEVSRIFPRARRVGAKFGVMLVHKYGHDVEVATFRTDGPYSDGRHPDHVEFGTEGQDALRRDFTINGLFQDPTDDRVIDHVGGQEDLNHRIVRTIGDPQERFAEDHLRMLRAVRFATRLGFEIEPRTADAIKRLADRLRGISPERVWRELEEILAGPERMRGWTLLVATGLRAHLATHWPQMDSDTLVTRRLAALPARPVDPALGLAAVFRGAGDRQITDACEALRLSNRMARRVRWLVSTLDTAGDESSLELADLKVMMADPAWAELVDLLKADLIATEADRAPVERLRRRAAAIAEKDISPKALLSGDELLEMGMAAGPRMGELLDALYRAQLNEQIKTHDEAVAKAKAHMAGD